LQAVIADVAGDLKEGQPADIPVLDVQTGRFPLTDVAGGTRAVVGMRSCRS
jgi:hypothetical protein